jgi:hypothetical protein
MLPATGGSPTVRKAVAQDKILPLTEAWAAPADFARARNNVTEGVFRRERRDERRQESDDDGTPE